VHLVAGARGKPRGHVHRIGHDGQPAARGKRLGDEVHRAARVHEDGLSAFHECGHLLRDGALLAHAGGMAHVDRGFVAGEYGTAVHAADLTTLGQFDKIAADRLAGHAQLRDDAFHRDLAAGTEQVANTGMSFFMPHGVVP